MRDQAFKAMNMFMARLTAMIKDMVSFLYTRSMFSVHSLNVTS